VDKHIIPKGEQVIRAALQRLRPLVEEGGYIPIPDHRIPPDCSLEQFRTYVKIFQEVFARS
jgi:uroporphyrinogen decarboxylase